MPRIYNATFQPFSYEELATPLRESTLAHQKVEDDYNNNMLVVDSLRQRAMNEPDANWSKQILDYANNLEAYAMDLARNGLTRETRNNLFQVKRGYGTTVAPVMQAMVREKELLTIRDKANPATRTLYGAMPTIDEIIANPNIGLSSYSGKDIYDTSKALAGAFASRNIELIPPRNISAWMYEYGKKLGFTGDEINLALQDPMLNLIFNSIKQQYGYLDDSTLTDQQKLKLDNEILLGALEGLIGTVDMKYGNRPDDPLSMEKLEGLRLANQITRLKINGDSNDSDNSMLHTEYYVENKDYQNLLGLKEKLGVLYDLEGKLKNEFKDFLVYNENGKPMPMDFMKAYKTYIEPIMQYHNAMANYRNSPIGNVYDPEMPDVYQKPEKPKIFKDMSDEKLEALYNHYKSIGATQETYNALKDFNVDNLTNSETALTIGDLEYYMNDLKNALYSTNIVLTKYDDVAAAIKAYTSEDNNKGYAKDIIDIGPGLSKGDSYNRDKKLKLNEIEGKDIVNVEYTIADHDHIYITLSNGKKLSIPMSFFSSELRNEVNKLYNIGEKDSNGNWTNGGMPYMAYIDSIDNMELSKEQKSYLKGHYLKMFQDSIAKYIMNYFKNRETPVYGDTEKRED